MLRMKVKAGDRILVGDVVLTCGGGDDGSSIGLEVLAAHTITDEGHILIGDDIRIVKKRGVSGANMTLSICAPIDAAIIRESAIPPGMRN